MGYCVRFLRDDEKIELDTLTEITELQDKKSNRKCSTLTQITP